MAASSTSQPCKDRLGPDESLRFGECLISSSGEYIAIMQTDGNFVLYRTIGDQVSPIWATNTRGNDHRIVMQRDNNLVIYDASSKGHWDSNTSQQKARPAASLVLQDDGNLVIYSGDGGGLWDCRKKPNGIHAIGAFLKGQQPIKITIGALGIRWTISKDNLLKAVEIGIKLWSAKSEEEEKK